MLIKTGTAFISPYEYRNSFSNMSNVQTTITESEKKILILLAREYTHKEIAQTLNLSKDNLKVKIRMLLNKTGCRKSTGLVNFAFENQLINGQ